MAARRLITVMIVLLVLSSIAAALVPVERAANDESSSTSTTTTAEPADQAVQRTVDVSKPKPTKIRLALGDRLDLTVRSQGPAQIEIPDFGELEDTDQYLPAHFDLLPFRPGASPVILRREDGSSRTVARIVVQRPGAGPEKR